MNLAWNNHRVMAKAYKRWNKDPVKVQDAIDAGLPPTWHHDNYKLDRTCARKAMFTGWFKKNALRKCKVVWR
jgi:hypothetical protein